MSFIGNTPTTQLFTSSSQQFSGDGSTTSFTLDRGVYSVNDIEVLVNNVQQDPFSAYTVSATTLTFTGAPSLGSGNITVIYRSYVTTSIVPVDSSVTTAKMASNITLTGNTTTSNLIVTGNVTGNLTVTGNVTVSTSVAVTRNVSTSNIIVSNLATTSNLLVTGNTTTGNLTATGNVTVSTSVDVTRNVSTSNIIVSNLATTSNLLVTGNTTTGNLKATGTIVSNVAGVGQFSSESIMGFKNRIINGAMVIDQRNAGASLTIPANAYTYSVDRWFGVCNQASKFALRQNVNSVTPPAGFSNYLGATSASAYTLISTDYFTLGQAIEGFNFADLAWGTASAATITVSFWVYSSLTGTFGGAIQNSAQSRAYPFTYSISVANTWEQKTVTIAGDTSGTWIGATNGIGARVFWSLGSGTAQSGTAGAWVGSAPYSVTGATSVVSTNGATFYITGVQLEKGSTATSFDYRPFGTELILAQRYFETTYPIGTAVGTASTDASAPVAFSMGDSGVVTQQIIWMYKVKKCSAPTVTVYNPNSGASGSARYAGTTNINFNAQGSRVDQATFGSGSAGMAINSTFSYYMTANSEL